MLNSHKIRARRQQGSGTAHPERCSSSVFAVTGHSTHICSAASVSTAFSTPLGLEACVITALRGSCCPHSHAGAAGGVVILGLLALLAALLVRRKRRHARSAAPRLAVPFSFSRSDSGSDKVRGTREPSPALQGLRLRVQALEGLRPPNSKAQAPEACSRLEGSAKHAVILWPCVQNQADVGRCSLHRIDQRGTSQARCHARPAIPAPAQKHLASPFALGIEGSPLCAPVPHVPSHHQASHSRLHDSFIGP